MKLRDVELLRDITDDRWAWVAKYLTETGPNLRQWLISKIVGGEYRGKMSVADALKMMEILDHPYNG